MSVTNGNLSTTEVVDGYVLEKNVEIPLKAGSFIRANLYRPDDDEPHPVICTYGPYGKDIKYSVFHPKSWSEVPSTQKSTHSSWETPDPKYWTSHGYAVLRIDERGSGQSPGVLDTMSAATADCFFDAIEWAAVQPWSTGKVGLLGISYYAGSQWRVAAKRPKGLAAMVPWEGMADYYRDRVRHGGILSNGFISRWFAKQVKSNQYGLAGRAARNWGEDTLEGDLPADVLEANLRDQTVDTARYRYRDEPYFASKDYDLADIEVPLLSVVNWGGIQLHLRGNVLGYMYAGSKQKFLRCVTGRHDLPFYYEEQVDMQRSFLDAFLKGQDSLGWSMRGKLSPVELVLREGSPGYNDAEAERKRFPRRVEDEWPIARTSYRKLHLTGDALLDESTPEAQATVLSYDAPDGLISFTKTFSQKTEITGHPVLRVTMSLTSKDGSQPEEMDIFVTLRHIDVDGQEVFYTGSSGDPVPVVKGWLRASLRAVDQSNPLHKPYLPHRNYYSTDVQPVKLNEAYTMDIEIWPTNVVIGAGAKLVLEIASSDTQGSQRYPHNHPVDRNPERFRGVNNIHIGARFENYLLVPVIPERS